MVKIGMLIADRYEVLEKIGTGGMSVVYKAKDHKLNRFVAVKILKQEFADNANFVSKFRIEAQAAGGLIHPNVVNVYDVGDEKGINYIVMELVDGITLKKYIEKKARLSTKEAISIAIQVSMGLQAAHQNHIIHRDIKPQNIIISKDGKVKVTDFGIAKAATSNTITSNVMGSVHYTSPEQARGGYSDERSDIYSLGVTLFEMLTGRVPFNGETTVAIAIKHIQTPMPSPREFVPDVPHSVEQIVLKCCEKSPDRRYQNMDELVADLKQSLIHPEDDFVKVIHPDEDGATRVVTNREADAVRRRDMNYEEEPVDHYQDDYDTDPEDVEDYREEDEVYQDRRTSRFTTIKKNKDVRPQYEEDDYADDYEDNYDPRKERRITLISVLAAIVIGAIIIVVAAVKLGLIGGGAQTTVEQTQEGMVTMPTVVGLDEATARTSLTTLGLVAEVEYSNSDSVASGIVISASSTEGTQVAAGSSIVLTVSAGVNGIDVPDVTGKSKAEAVATLQSAGFKVSREEAADDEVEEGDIISQDPEGGSKAPAGTTVTITISTGPEMEGKAKVPSITGLTVEEASARLVEAGLQLGDSSTAETTDSNLDGTVKSQSIAKDEVVEEDTTVDIVVYRVKATTYSCTIEIASPALEDPNYVEGTAVYVVLIAADGQQLLNTTYDSFPKQFAAVGLASGSGTLQMSYTDITVDENGVQNGTEQKVVTRQYTFTPEN